MTLKPLEQWFCDRCGDVIQKPEDGWVHWRRGKDRKIHSIEILHHLMASPKGGQDGCYAKDPDSDLHLHHMLGTRGLVILLSMVDVGRYHDPAGKDGGVADLRNWAETFRRLHVPHYEEARRYFDQARADGELEGVNEVALYLEDTLTRLIKRYG
jgi:hypothetical protein